MNNLIAGLKILKRIAKANNDADLYPEAERDIIYVSSGRLEMDLEDEAKLEALGWKYSSSFLSWAYQL